MMILILMCLIIGIPFSYSQDVFDFYQNRNQFAPPVLRNENYSYEFEYPTLLNQCNYYDGEYEIVLDELFWANNAFSQTTCISFQYKVVSFPFATDCAFTGGCGFNCNPTPPANYTDERLLKMPDQPGVYSSASKAWIYPAYGGNIPKLFLETPISKFDGIVSSDGLVNPGHTLVSRSFSSNMLSYLDRALLPHTVLEIILRLHCGSSTTGNVVNTIRFLYDNTRGRMRFYPFYNTNCNQSSLDKHDQVFRPTLLYNDYFIQYNIPPDDIIQNEYKTLDYFDFENIDDGGCSGLAPTDPSDFFLSQSPLWFSYVFEPPKTLYTYPLRQSRGEAPAGYEIVAGNLVNNSSNLNHRHQYFINRDIDFSLINSDDKVIYNPSEVSIDPDLGNPANNNPPIEVIFPTGYTFKTVLGRYPSVQQVTDANLDPQNGGFYTDLRQVPVPVNAADLPQSPGTVASDYPDVMWDDPLTVDVNGFYDDERFGYYYVKSKSTLRLENCVRLFDARFSVDAGGTMIFEDYSGILGYEDTDANLGRYKIRGEGGAILRNYATVQYVQNGDIFQTTPLEYIALNAIMAGNNVDPDADQPDGDYSIGAGAHVTFKSGDYIYLGDGFSVLGGEFHGYIDENIQVPVPCFNPNVQNGGNRIGQSSAWSNRQPAGIDMVQVSPNPSSGTFIVNLISGQQIHDLTVFNSIGQPVYRFSQENTEEVLVSLPDNHTGLYLVQVNDFNGNKYMAKVMLGR